MNKTSLDQDTAKVNFFYQFWIFDSSAEYSRRQSSGSRTIYMSLQISASFPFPDLLFHFSHFLADAVDPVFDRIEYQEHEVIVLVPGMDQPDYSLLQYLISPVSS